MRQKLLYILGFCSALSLQAQEDIIKYKTAPATSDNVACKGFTLQPDFTFKATSTRSMTFRINPSACSMSETKTSISGNQNYIVTLTPIGQTKALTYKKDGSITIDRTIEGDVNVLTQIQYFDGLGRPRQTVQRGITPAKSDLVTYQEYDAIGREGKFWLPAVIAGNNGAFTGLDIVKKTQSIYSSDNRAFNETEYEASPLSRVLKQYGPGDAWKNKPVTTGYLTNNSTYPCIMYSVGGTKDAPSLVKGSNYADGQLYVTEMKDEEGNTSYTFKDKLEQVILTRQINGTDKLDTYYVYDDFGNLTFVLPPLASTAADLNLYSYQYIYDKRNRCYKKKLPGADWILYVYDKADRPIFTQDGEQRTKSEWLFSIPDAFGRIVLTGTCKNVITNLAFLENIVVNANMNLANATNKYYDITGISLTTATILSANYYDNYEFKIKDDFTKLNYVAQSGYGAQYANSKGLLTGSMMAILDGSGRYLYTSLYYDYKGNVIQSKSTNHIDGVESEYIAYTFAGSPTKKLHTHTANGKTTQTELYTYAYDHAGRMTSTKHKLNNGSEILLVQNSYDELGRLSTSTANNQAGLKTTYVYNIRSWANSITNTHFVENLTYKLNGNIATQEWKQATQEWKQANKTRKYSFDYDNLSRIKSTAYTNAAFPLEKFTENMTYDKHGNIKTIKREGLIAEATYGTIDNLAFGYTGNQLLYITDSVSNINISTSADFKEYSKVTTAEYTFNKNGAMTKDLNKGIVSRSGTSLLDGISYNVLNLPKELVINNNEVKAKNYYTYSAMGTKLKVVYRFDSNGLVVPLLGTTPEKDGLKPKNTIDYVGNKIYEDGVLKTILTDNGYIEGGIYYFYIKDHLGNNRIVANASAGLIQSTQYYPFGMAFAEGTTTKQGKQPYKYNGKELDQSHGLNQYDYSARYYDPAYARFTTVDPHSENYYSWSPYAYCGNNPMRLTDPTGMDWRDKLVGYGIGVLTNTIPGSSTVRDAYTPNSSSDYNGALQIVDQISMIAGAAAMIEGGMSTGAGGGMIVAGAAVSGTVIGAPEGGALAATGAVVMGAGEVTMFGGAMLMNNAVSNSKEGYGRGSDTNSGSSREALRKAKDENGIPRSQQPDKTIKPNTKEGKEAGLDNRNVKQYEYTNSQGEKVTIRQDKAAKYNQGGKGDQGPHYNAGQGEALKQHHYYKDKPLR